MVAQQLVDTLSDTAISAFVSGQRGGCVRPGDAGYDDARRIWNGMIDRSPGLIARCADVDDVRRAVAFGRANDLLVAVRGGGHNTAGNALCEGGLVIDLSPMRGVRVDAANRTARAGGGATWGDFDGATGEYGLAATGGAISTTGIAGLTLGGGVGWLMRSYGLACDNLRAAEVVTADGRVVTASAEENADLYWGLRGGGGNFGVVTTFDYRLHPVSTVLGGVLIHPADRAGEVMRFVRDFNRDAPDELTAYFGVTTAPDGARVVLVPVCYNGAVEEGEKALRPLREFGPPLVDQVGPMPYVAQQKMLDEGFPPGLQVYWSGEFLQALTDEVIDLTVEHFANVTSPLSAVLFERMGGAVARVGREETAFDHRDAEYNVALIARWADPSEAEGHIAWLRGLQQALRPHSRGGYVNYLAQEGEDRVKAAYGAATYDRLIALKNRYDPTNFFSLNQNIKPTG